jgi:hypothetical protein
MSNHTKHSDQAIEAMADDLAVIHSHIAHILTIDENDDMQSAEEMLRDLLAERAELQAERERGVVPDYWIAVDESSGCIEFGLSSCDANEGESSREQVNDFINNTDTSFRLVGVYASPTPPASEVVE